MLEAGTPELWAGEGGDQGDWETDLESENLGWLPLIL